MTDTSQYRDTTKTQYDSGYGKDLNAFYQEIGSSGFSRPELNTGGDFNTDMSEVMGGSSNTVSPSDPTKKDSDLEKAVNE